MLEPDSIPDSPPLWIVTSEYRTRTYNRCGEIAPRGNLLKKLEESGYYRYKVFSSTPSFMGIAKPRPEIIPQDFYHIAPSITILKRAR